MGNYAAAEPLLRQAGEICRMALRAGHPHYAASLNNLAVLYLCDGQLRGGRAPATGRPWRSAARPWGRTTPTMPPA